MYRFRIKNRRLHILTLLFSIAALLFVQGSLLHIHTLQGHLKSGGLHQYQPETHLVSADPTPTDEGHSLASQIDLQSNGVVKNLKFSNPLLAILTLAVILTFSLITSGEGWRIVRKTPINRRCLLIRPPLRAPPL